MVQDFISGNLDAIYMFPPAQFDKIKATEGVETREYNFWNWDYVGFNCYDGPSGGHPALRDPQFRGALEYAVDREKILSNAYSGRGIPGYTFLPPDTWSDPDYAWAPDDTQRRDYDPDTANQMLDDAGYPDKDGDGVREYKGEPITLRLWADKETPEAARACKLIAGWWEAVGIDVKFSVQDQGVYFDNIWGYKGDTFYPDFDAYYWEWDGYFDPGQTLTCFSPAQIEGWNEFSWNNEEYGRLDALQAAGDGRGQARRVHLADAAGHVRGRPVLHDRPPVQASGLPHVDVGRLEAHRQRGQGRAAVRLPERRHAVGVRQPDAQGYRRG